VLVFYLSIYRDDELCSNPKHRSVVTNPKLDAPSRRASAEDALYQRNFLELGGSRGRHESALALLLGTLIFCWNLGFEPPRC
jgi:hypothetical protein